MAVQILFVTVALLVAVGIAWEVVLIARKLNDSRILRSIFWVLTAIFSVLVVVIFITTRFI